jgi:hypothetical protein
LSITTRGNIAYGPGTIERIDFTTGPTSGHARNGRVVRPNIGAQRRGTPRIDRPTVGSIS